MAGLHQILECLQQHPHIFEVQAGRRLVKNEERRLGSRGFQAGELRQMTDQLQALAFASGKGVDRLSQPQVAQPDFLQQLEAAQSSPARRGVDEGKEHLDSLVDGGLQKVGDAPAAGFGCRPAGARAPSGPAGRSRRRGLGEGGGELDLQDVRAVTASLALRAADIDIAEELHLDFLEARAPATLALALAGIKTERAGAQATLARPIGLREQFADGIEGPDIDRRIGTGSFAERRLVHQHYATKMLVAPQARGRRMGTRGFRLIVPVVLRGAAFHLGGVRRLAGGFQTCLERGQEDFASQGGFSRAAHPG